MEMVYTYIQLDLTTNWNLEAGVMDAHWHWFQCGTGSTSGSGSRVLILKTVRRTSKLQEKPLAVERESSKHAVF
jgi:hypothetical protein